MEVVSGLHRGLGDPLLHSFKLRHWQPTQSENALIAVAGARFLSPGGDFDVSFDIQVVRIAKRRDGEL